MLTTKKSDRGRGWEGKGRQIIAAYSTPFYSASPLYNAVHVFLRVFALSSVVMDAIDLNLVHISTYLLSMHTYIH